MAQHQAVSVETLKAIASAFNTHDLDTIMEFFADECSLDMPRGPEPWGQRFVGKAAVREGRRVRVRGCDQWEFRDGKVVRKDSYWKIVEKPV
jgi:ketosteroid isomerase-like protein